MIFTRLIFLTCATVLLVLPFAAASSFADRTRELSNGERIRRRLPLKAPKRRFDPTRPRRALSPRASDTSRSAIMVLTDMQKRADVVGYLGFDDYGYLIPTTDASKAQVFTIPTLATGTDLEIQSVSNKNYLCVWKSGNPGLTNWSGTLATEPSDGGTPLGKDPQTSIFGFAGYGTSVSAMFRYDATTTLDLVWWDVEGYVICTPRGASAPEVGARLLHVEWAQAP